MQDLDRDLRDAFNKLGLLFTFMCLIGNYQERVIGMSKYWARDAHFFHVVFKAFNRDDAWGVYQLWSANNLGLGITYDEIFSDKRHNGVLLDITEHCHVWWWPPFHQDVKIHTILDLRDTPHGKVIVHQYDHTLAMETLLYNTMPWLGEIARKYVLPFNGEVLASLGNIIYHHLQHKDALPALGGPALLDPEVTIPRAAETLFSCSAGERYALVHRAFAPDAFYYNSFLTLSGRDKIFGLFNFWSNINRKIDVKVVRVVPCLDRERILVDAVQTWTPYLWPTFLLHPPVFYQHILMTTKDNPAGGKLITKAENYIITLDPFLKYQIGAPYEALRAFNGRLFGAAGRSIHHFMEWWHSNKIGDKVAAHVPNGVQELAHKLKK